MDVSALKPTPTDYTFKTSARLHLLNTQPPIKPKYGTLMCLLCDLAKPNIKNLIITCPRAP